MERYIKITPEDKSYDFWNSIYEELEEAKEAEKKEAEHRYAKADYSKSWTTSPFGNRYW